jgi:death-on-curing protein
VAAAEAVKRRVGFLSADQVVRMHDLLLERFGGSPGGGARGSGYEGLDAAVQAVKNSYYETIEELAAAYAVYVVQGPVVLDGNKRAAAAAMLVFLEANGVTVRLPAPALAGMMIDLQRRAEAGDGVAALVSWIAGILRARGATR